MKLAAKLIPIILLLLIFVQPAYAHGLVYETQQTGENKIKITIKWSDPTEKKGIAITQYYLKNVKTLDIGCEIKDGAPTTVSMDYNLTNALPPVRIIISGINNANGSLFADIKGIEAEDYIRHLHDAGIINGRSGNLYKPDETITRAEFMVLLTKALKLDGAVENTQGYNDISSHWAKNAILLAAGHGLVSGYKDKTFRPDNPITLAEVSTIISKAFKFKTNRNGIYAKLKQNVWYSGYVKEMFDTGILNISDSIYKNFNEQSNINRANCAIMVSRALSTY